MKFIKENIEKLSYNKETNIYRNGTHYYVYKDSCSVCGDPYLTDIRQNGKYCDIFCSNKNKNSGKMNNNWKGGVTKKNIPLF